VLPQLPRREPFVSNSATRGGAKGRLAAPQGGYSARSCLVSTWRAAARFQRRIGRPFPPSQCRPPSKSDSESPPKCGHLQLPA